MSDKEQYMNLDFEVIVFENHDVITGSQEYEGDDPY